MHLQHRNTRCRDGATEVAAIFLARVTTTTPALVKAYRAKMIFTGRGQPPKEAPSSAAVRQLVADNPALIGRIDKSALEASVKPVLLVH